MLHVLYIIIFISCPTKRNKIGEGHATSYGSYVNCVNMRSENFLLLSDLIFA